MIAAQIETQIETLRAQHGEMASRLPALDRAISETRQLVGEADTRLKEAGAAVARAQIGGGEMFAFTGPPQQRVTYTDGTGTVQLAGPAPAGTPKGAAEHARARYDALEAEALPIRGALSNLEREKATVSRDLGLIGLEIESLERQLAGQRRAEAEHAALVGPLGWQDRLSAIMRRLRWHADPNN